LPLTLACYRSQSRKKFVAPGGTLGVYTQVMAEDKNPLAVALGKLAGAKLTKAQRVAKARKAAKARWANHAKVG